MSDRKSIFIKAMTCRSQKKKTPQVFPRDVGVAKPTQKHEKSFSGSHVPNDLLQRSNGLVELLGLSIGLLHWITVTSSKILNSRQACHEESELLSNLSAFG